MSAHNFRNLCILSIVLLTLASCNLPTANQAASPTLAATEQGSQSGQTSTPDAATPSLIPITDTPAGTSSPTIVPDTATPTLPVGIFPSDTPTATIAPILAEVMKDTNCRIGPAGNYDLVTTFKTGAKVEVLAQDLGGGFIFVKNPDKPDDGCYILSNNVKLSGDISAFPQFTPPASPTLEPKVNITFKRFDICKGNVYALFTVQNIGGVPFRSAYIRATDTKAKDVEEQTWNAFDLWTGCIIAKNIAPLNPGDTGYLASAHFKRDPRSDGTLLATFQVCSNQNLQGYCYTTSIQFP